MLRSVVRAGLASAEASGAEFHVIRLWFVASCKHCCSTEGQQWLNHVARTSSWLNNNSVDECPWTLVHAELSFQVNIYLMQIIFGAVDFPAKLFALGVLSYLGRRFSQSLCLFLSGLIIFANIFIPPGNKHRHARKTTKVSGTKLEPGPSHQCKDQTARTYVSYSANSQQTLDPCLRSPMKERWATGTRKNCL